MNHMNQSIEIHDSTLVELTWHGSDLLLAFDPAYVHRSEGTPAVDSGTGWIETAHLKILYAQLHDVMPCFPLALSHGSVRHGGGTLDNFIPVPFRHFGPIHITLEALNGTQVNISGSGLTVCFVGTGRFVESFVP
jgi:hypothetical protein